LGATQTTTGRSAFLPGSWAADSDRFIVVSALVLYVRVAIKRAVMSMGQRCFDVFTALEKSRRTPSQIGLVLIRQWIQGHGRTTAEACCGDLGKARCSLHSEASLKAELEYPEIA
jgi:hypothetical protein